MRSSYNRYNSYKENDITFPNEIPSHWVSSKIGYDFEVQLGKMIQPEPKSEVDELLPYLRSANIQWKGVDLSSQKMMWFSPKDRNTFLLKHDDLLICEGGDVGRCSIWSGNQEMYIQNAINRVRGIGKGNPRFLYYWIMVLKQSGLIDILCDSSTIAHYTAEKVKATSYLRPPIDEQQSIANFLDKKTKQIDDLIEQKEKLLQLLTEKRTAIITQAVTKGLNPKVKMKDSGIEWLGEVPEHWEVKRFKFCLALPFQYGANEVAERSDPEEPRFIRITDLDDNGGLRDETFKSLDHEVAKPFLLEDGDILLARSGATVGKTFIYRKEWGKACFAGYLIRARLNKRILDPSFCIRFLSSGIYWSWVNSIFIQATIQNISAEKYASLVIPLPPIEEQLKISDYLNANVSKIDSLKGKLTDSLERLKEYRSSLITSAVTGQIDVRKVSTAD